MGQLWICKRGRALCWAPTGFIKTDSCKKERLYYCLHNCHCSCVTVENVVALDHFLLEVHEFIHKREYKLLNLSKTFSAYILLDTLVSISCHIPGGQREQHIPLPSPALFVHIFEY